MSLAKTQFKYMMWKNWIIIKRNPSETIMDIMYVPLCRFQSIP